MGGRTCRQDSFAERNPAQPRRPYRPSLRWASAIPGLQHRQQRQNVCDPEPAAGYRRIHDPEGQKTYCRRYGGRQGNSRCRTAPDTVEISLDLTKFGITKASVSPAVNVSSQPNTPPVAYAAQSVMFCENPSGRVLFSNTGIQCAIGRSRGRRGTGRRVVDWHHG
jgi:hypothetical protein